jgi:hypothetical protein
MYSVHDRKQRYTAGSLTAYSQLLKSPQSKPTMHSDSQRDLAVAQLPPGIVLLYPQLFRFASTC